MNNIGQLVDSWWSQQGREAFVARATVAANDSKVKLILSDTKLSREEKLAKIEARVDKDLVPFLVP